MVKWYLATYQNGIFLNDLGIIQSTGDSVYKLKNPIESSKSPVKSDWLRITIEDNKVEEWDGSWTPAGEDVTGLVNESTYWVYGTPYSYRIVTNDQTYYLEDLTTLNDIGKTNITSVIIGNSVETIGDSAFYGCKNLRSVIIPDSVETIGINAFRDCSNLTSLTIGNSVETIGINAFYFCEKLTSVTIPNSVTSIGEWAFKYCSSLAFVTIPDSVTSIGDGAFYNIGSELGNAVGTIIISRSTATRLATNDKYNSGTLYWEQQFFFSGLTYVNINLT